MDPLLAEVRKALGGKQSDLWKRFSAAHKGQIVRVGEHVDKAMGFHKSAVKKVFGPTDSAMKAHGAAIECCKRMGDMLDKVMALHKAHFGKGLGSESNAYPHAEVNGHLEAMKAAMGEMQGNMTGVSKAARDAFGMHKDTDDQHNLAKGTLSKVTSSWVGEESESPSAAGLGYDPRQAGSTSNLPQSRVTEGEVPDYSSFEPYPKTAAAGANQVTEAEAKLREENALLKGKIEGMQGTITAIGNRPGERPAGRVFNVAGAGQNLDGMDPVDKIIHKLREAKALSQFELDNIDKPEVRQRIAAKAIGMQAVLGDSELVDPNLRDTSFGRSLLHPAMRSDPNAIAKRAAAGSGSFNPVGPTSIYK